MPPVIAAIVAFSISAVTAVGLTGAVGAWAAAALSTFIVAAGAGMVMWGVGTLFSAITGSGSALGGGGMSLTASINPLAPWNVQYGRGRVGGDIVYRGSFGDNDKYLDLVMILACHPCEAVDWLILDNQKVQIGSIHTTAHGWKGNSFQPLQQTIAIASPSDISRTNNVVTITLNSDIPLLEVGDQVIVQKVHPVNLLLNGRFPVTSVSRDGGHLTFTYLAGGPAIPPGTIDESGEVKTTWPDYKSKIYMEVMLGTQALGDTFEGMLYGTPYDGDYDDMQTNGDNPWTSNCSLVGKTAVFLRLHYNDQVFANGLPQISFLVRGKNDIYDPRTTTTGYTENAALCIADYLANQKWGYKAAYGTAIPSAPLIAAANICDESVSVAYPSGGTEPRYTCNGGFPLNMHRSAILQNLLTSCAGRLTYAGGQFVIWPAAWAGVSDSITGTKIYDMLTSGFRWRPTASITSRFNGVKGTYVSPVNSWQPSDFPRYAQDAVHGYSWGTTSEHDANLDADGGDRRWYDIQLPFTVSCSMAQRIAKIELLRRRNDGTGTFPLTLAAYKYQTMDVIALDLPYFGWSGKNLEILAVRPKMEKQATDGGDEVAMLTAELDVQETDSSIYSWSVGEELSPQGYQQAITPDTRTPAPPTMVLLDSDSNSIYVTWIAPADGFVLSGGHIEIEYQLVASPEGLWLSLAKMDPTVTTATIAGLTAGDQYNVRIRSVNAAGVPCDWVLGSPFNSSPLVPGPITVAGALTVWQPVQEQASASDPLWPSEWNFGVDQSGSLLTFSGRRPVNSFIDDCPAPSISSAAVSVNSTGGTIRGGTALLVYLVVWNGSRLSPPSKPLVVTIPAGTDTNSLTLTGVSYPSVVGLTDAWLFAAYIEDLECVQTHEPLSGGPSYSPTTLTCGTINRTDIGLPNAGASFVRVRGKRLWHGGVLGARIDSITPLSPSGCIVVAGEAVDTASPPSDDWTGRVFIPIGRQSGSIPFVAATTTDFDPLTGAFTLDRDLSSALQVGDIFVVGFKGYDNSANRRNVADAGIANGTNGHAGMTPSAEAGAVIRVIAGTSRGETRNVIDNGTFDWTVDSDLTLDSTSVWVVEVPSWEVTADSAPGSCYDPYLSIGITTQNNLTVSASMLFMGFVVDGSGHESGELDSPIRLAYVWGGADSSSAEIVIAHA